MTNHNAVILTSQRYRNTLRHPLNQ